MQGIGLTGLQLSSGESVLAAGCETDGGEKAPRQGDDVGNREAGPGKKEVGAGREDRKEAARRLAAGQEGRDLAADPCEGCGNEGDYRQLAPRLSVQVSRTMVVAVTRMWAPG